jgi:hypothetical protein
MWKCKVQTSGHNPNAHEAWAHVHAKWLDFAAKSQNLILAISTNSFNPFSKKLCQWSTWPMYVLIYNLPPWLTTKCFFCASCIDNHGQRKCIYEQHKYLPPTTYGWTY